ncbi:4-aminobutyrate--2-oxoglutarate transaminase [Mycolicibacterium sp.]|uniref:4-aminobutyrate--2-oxoglutarate transaminase n=1 Tax=Mycolicibacterium sp. TaxID=2320850 RepID=UPI001A284FF2|nr:4-aminobutyrate--2-oxoglutarate transaminase [Mycolicibacterium sp.]MBJ7341277.1 4-aminobutyrate--2-oxoglutarate transaminase [Mycolicibacterium sp.]
MTLRTHARRLATTVPGPLSEALAARKTAAVADGVSTTLPAYVDHASADGLVIDVDGNALIDMGSGIAVTSIGNSAERVIAAVKEQVERFTHTCFMVSPYEGYVAVAEALNALTPGRHDKRSALFNSGAEAVENAIKIARHHTNRTAVVAFDHAYHGRTNLTMALTAKEMPYKHGFGPFAPAVYRAPLSYPLRDGAELTGSQAAQRAIAHIESSLDVGDLAAIIIEPIQGEGGFIEPALGFLPALHRWCRQNGVLFIADEVQTGFARTGRMFACEHEGIVPDLIVTAKGIAGGLPLAAVTGTAEVMNAVHAGGLGGTYGGNPIACAAALAAIETIHADDLLGKAARIEDVMKRRLQDMQATDPRIGQVRGRGAMIAIELVQAGGLVPDPALTAAVATEARRRGVIVLTCGTHGNVIRFLPPLTIREDLLDEALDVIAAAFEAIR